MPEALGRLRGLLRGRAPAAAATAGAARDGIEPGREDGFDEASYLEANPDVRVAVGDGRLASGEEHWRAFGRQEGRALRLRVARTVDELDREVARLRVIEQRSMSEWLRARSSFSFAEDLASLPSDPFSAAYRERQLALYCQLSGRPGYDAPSAEAYRMPIEKYVDPTPYPFSSRDGGLIGLHLMAVGQMMQAIWQHRPGAGLSILEYGCGTGLTTTLLAASGYRMTAVDINADMLEIVRRVAADRKLAVRTHQGQFGEVPEEGERFDIVLFYESFHHCLRFDLLLNQLHARLAPGGLVVLAGEPVFADFPKPWGLRLDGPALYDIRSAGWLELGFREAFFRELLARTGWAGDKVRMPPAPDLFVLRPLAHSA